MYRLVKFMMGLFPSANVDRLIVMTSVVDSAVPFSMLELHQTQHVQEYGQV